MVHRPEWLQDLPDALEPFIGGPDEDVELAPARLRNAAADRGVDDDHTLGHSFTYGADLVGTDRGHVHQHLSRAKSPGEASFEHDALEDLWVGKHGDGDIDPHGRLGGRGRRHGAAVEQGLRLLVGAIPHREIVTGLEQTGRHRRPHHPEAEEGDLGHVVPPSCVGMPSG